jgi:hypothetical protein
MGAIIDAEILEQISELLLCENSGSNGSSRLRIDADTELCRAQRKQVE